MNATQGSKAPLSIALIGCGRISRRHIQVINDHPELRLAAACDLDAGKARSATEGMGIPVYSDMVEMVREERPEVAAILTESGSHGAVGMAVAPYVSALVVEKPMTLTLEDADALIEMCERHQTRLFVVKQNRYNPPVRKLRAAVEAGRFGKLVLGTVRVRWTRDQSYYDQADWRGTWKNDGGVLTNQASHHVDLLQWMMGPVESVYAYTARQLVDIESEDTAVAVLRFTSGALGIVEATTATRPRDLEGSLSILGAGGSVVIGGFAVNELVTWNFATPEPGDEGVFDSTVVPPNVYGFGHREFYGDVIQAIRTGRHAMLDGLEGRKSLELIHAFYESAATGREVRLRYVSRNVPLGS